MLRKPKTFRAAKHTARATSLFDDAHRRLSKAADLYRAAQVEHQDLSRIHAGAASVAAVSAERAERVRDRLADLVS